MKILFNVTILVLMVPGCAGLETKKQDQMYADAIAQPEIRAQFIAAQENAAKERAIAESEENGRILKLQAEIQAKEDARKKSEAEKKQAETERRDAQDRQYKADKEARLAERERTRPKCMNIIFTGVAAGGQPAFLDEISKSKKLEDILARNPLSCTMVMGGSQCSGYSYFRKHKGTVARWDYPDWYTINTTVDFTERRADVNIWIRKKDARCAK
jgi:hypothetical protein